MNPSYRQTVESEVRELEKDRLFFVHHRFTFGRQEYVDLLTGIESEILTHTLELEGEA